MKEENRQVAVYEKRAFIVNFVFVRFSFISVLSFGAAQFVLVKTLHLHESHISYSVYIIWFLLYLYKNPKS